MDEKILVVVLLSVICECYGHLPSLTGILNDAHKHVHSTIHGVANSVLGGGFNLNFGAHIDTHGYGNHHDHGLPQRPQHNNEETIVVVVEESQPNNYGNVQYKNSPPNGPYNMHGQNNNYNHPNVNQNPYNQNPHQNYGRPQPNNYGSNSYSNQNHYGNEPNDYDSNGNSNGNYGNQDQNNYAQNNNYNGAHDSRTYGNNNQNHRPTQNGYGNQQEQPGYNNANNHSNNNNHDGNAASLTERPTEEAKPDYGDGNGHATPEDKTTKKPDEPLHVPLNPNEYVYGGDKITVTGPKREVDPAKEIDEDSDIDIRFKDE